MSANSEDAGDIADVYGDIAINTLYFSNSIPSSERSRLLLQDQIQAIQAYVESILVHLAEMIQLKIPVPPIRDNMFSTMRILQGVLQ